MLFSYIAEELFKNKHEDYIIQEYEKKFYKTYRKA